MQFDQRRRSAIELVGAAWRELKKFEVRSAHLVTEVLPKCDKAVADQTTAARDKHDRGSAEFDIVHPSVELPFSCLAVERREEADSPEHTDARSACTGTMQDRRYRPDQNPQIKGD
jgi:hypothetical protein